MRVGSLYYEIARDASTNRERLLRGLRKAGRSTDVVVCPEAATTSVSRDTEFIHREAEPIPGTTVDLAQEVVEETGAMAVFGLAERSDSKFYNSCVLLRPGKGPEVYRQPHYKYTYGWTTGYGHRRVFDTSLAVLGPSICAGITWEETRSFLERKGADVVVMPANWAESDGEKPLVEQWKHYSEQMGLPFVVSNICGTVPDGNDSFTFDGPAAIIADGTVLQETTSAGTHIVGDV